MESQKITIRATITKIEQATADEVISISFEYSPWMTATGRLGSKKYGYLYLPWKALEYYRVGQVITITVG